MALLGLARTWGLERYSPFFVCLGGGGQIQVCQSNLFRTLRSEVPERLANDSVVAYFLPVLIAEDQDSVGESGRVLQLAGAR